MVCSLTSVQFGAAISVQLFPEVGAAGASTLRLGLSAVILLAATRPAVRHWTRAQWAGSVLLGVSLACMNGLFYQAIDRIPLGTAVTIEFLGPLALAAALSRRAREIAWALVAFGGVLLLRGQSIDGHHLDHVGILFAVGAAVFWAYYIVTASRAARSGVGFGGLAIASVVAAALTLPFGVASAGTTLVQPHILLVGLAVALLASVIPYSCELAALARMPKRVFSVLLALEPATAALVGALLLGQNLGGLAVAGIAVVVLAGVGSTLGGRDRADVPPLPG